MVAYYGLVKLYPSTYLIYNILSRKSRALFQEGKKYSTLGTFLGRRVEEIDRLVIMSHKKRVSLTRP